MRFAIVMLAACGGGRGGDLEVVCGEPGQMFDIHSESQLDELAGCTTLAGSLRFGDTLLASVDGLETLRVIEGSLNLFRNPGLADLGGLANLQTVRGELLVHFNDMLGSAQLASVRECGGLLVSANATMTELGLDDLVKVTGDLRIISNPALPQEAAVAFATGVVVGGEVEVSGNL